MSSMPTSSAGDRRVEKEQNKLAMSKFKKFIKEREEETFQVKISCRPTDNAKTYSKCTTTCKYGLAAAVASLPMPPIMKLLTPLLTLYTIERCHDDILEHLLHFGLEFYWYDGSYAFTLERCDTGLFFTVKDAAPASVFVPPCILCPPLRVQLRTAMAYLVEQSDISYHILTENCQHFCSHFWAKYNRQPFSDENAFCYNIRKQYWQKEMARRI
jgi:hypothetical protein